MKDIHHFIKRKNRLNQLRGFYYAARFQSMSQAAKIMGLTQSATTQQVKALSDDLGFELFKKGSRPLKLTSDGAEFYKEIASMVGGFDSAVENFLQQKNNKKQQEINIAAHHIAISHIMPKIIKEFKKKDPLSKIILRNISANEAIQRLRNNEIDLALYPFSEFSDDVNYLDIISYDPVLIINKSHPLAKEEINSLSQLKKYDFIRIDSKLITLPLFEENFKNYNLKGSLEFENGNWEMLINLVRENDFIALVSDFYIRDEKNIIKKSMSHFFPKTNYSIAHSYHKTFRKNVEIMLKIIKEFRENNI